MITELMSEAQLINVWSPINKIHLKRLWTLKDAMGTVKQGLMKPIATSPIQELSHFHTYTYTVKIRRVVYLVRFGISTPNPSSLKSLCQPHHSTSYCHACTCKCTWTCTCMLQYPSTVVVHRSAPACHWCQLLTLIWWGHSKLVCASCGPWWMWGWGVGWSQPLTWIPWHLACWHRWVHQTSSSPAKNKTINGSMRTAHNSKGESRLEETGWKGKG